MLRTLPHLLFVVASVAVAGAASDGFAQQVRGASTMQRSALVAAPQSLQTTTGLAIYAVPDGSGYRTSAANGTYRLTNGGAIRVSGGRITWDAFGAISRFRGANGSD